MEPELRPISPLQKMPTKKSQPRLVTSYSKPGTLVDMRRKCNGCKQRKPLAGGKTKPKFICAGCLK